MTSVPSKMPTPFGKLRYPQHQPYVDVRDPDTWEVTGREPAPLPRPRWDVDLVRFHPSTDASLGTYYAFSVDDPAEVEDYGSDAYPSDRWLLAEFDDNCYCPQEWAKVPF
jgi:hypothetical protein